MSDPPCNQYQDSITLFFICVSKEIRRCNQPSQWNKKSRNDVAYISNSRRKFWFHFEISYANEVPCDL